MKEAPSWMVAPFQCSGDWGTGWESDFSSPALPHPAPPKGWSLEAGPFFSTEQLEELASKSC